MAINKQTIISAFDDKLTLLQWLKTINKALEDGLITGFEIIQSDATHIMFKIMFADGTSVNSNTITLPQGEQGPQGPQGPQGEQGPQGPSSTQLYKHTMQLNCLSDENTDFDITIEVINNKSIANTNKLYTALSFINDLYFNSISMRDNSDYGAIVISCCTPNPNNVHYVQLSIASQAMVIDLIELHEKDGNIKCVSDEVMPL